MKKKILGLTAVFVSLVANLASAASFIGNNGKNTELDRLRDKSFKRSPSQKAVFLMPRSSAKLKFSWLIAHGSHVSHSSHASHVSHISHVSGTSSPSYTPNYSYTYTSPFSYATEDLPISAHVSLNSIDPKLLQTPEYGSIEVLKLTPGQNLLVVGYNGYWVKVKIEIDTQSYTGWIPESDIVLN